MAINDTVVVADSGIADNNSLIIDGSSTETGSVEVFELGGTVGAEIYKETDLDGDGSYEVSVAVDTTSNSWNTQQNQLVVSQSNDHRLKILNTSGGSGDFYAVGMEVDD